MAHKIFTLVASLSAILCAAIMIVWTLVPYGRAWQYYSPVARYTLKNWEKAISYEREEGFLRPDKSFDFNGKYMDTSWQQTHELPLGIVIGQSPRGNPRAAVYFRLLVPTWILVAVTAVLPVTWIGFWFRRRRLKKQAELQNRCKKCGYDLRASKDRCPECGTPFQRPEMNQPLESGLS